MKIVFTGGGTLGPVTPLLAAAKAIQKKRPDAEFIWYGTPSGPERAAVRAEGIDFHAIPVAKFPRYPSFRWLSFPFDYVLARIKAGRLLREDRPDLIVSAGGFTAVPVIKVAYKMRIPCAIHQLDKLPGLSNENVARFCDLVTTSFHYTASPFGANIKTRAIATPARFRAKDLPERGAAAKHFSLDSKKPIVFIVGGGTGAQALNEAVWTRLESWLKKTQVIHVTGRGKGRDISMKGYVQKEFLHAQDMLNAYAAADIVVSRAGMGAISELAALSKPSILIPIPHNQQEINAEALANERACIIIQQSKDDFPAELRKKVEELLLDHEARERLGTRLHEMFATDDGTELAELLLGLVKKNAPAR